MTMAIARWSCLLIVCLASIGCSSISMPQQPVTGETELFAQGLDQYLTTGDLTTLQLLSKQHPQGEWRSRADGVIAMAQRQQQQQAQEQKNNQALSKCLAEKRLLGEDNKILETTLERLKQVLIDTELKAN
jgi:hypothetical protein